MNRRTLLTSLGATATASILAKPSVAQSPKARTLRFVPTSGLLVLDPIVSTVVPTVDHGHYVFETLYSVDSQYRARPQMAEGHTISDDNLTWHIKLRPGLEFHDGERVLARDCVASIKRWGQRDAFGSTLREYTNEILATDDETIRFRLKAPFPILPDALAHPIASMCCIMPERLATTEASRAVTEVVGSGPFRFIPGEFVPGERAIYERNGAYVPREEKPDGMSGGKVAHFDRIEWVTLPDDATAAASLQAGEVDWWEVANFDLLGMMRRNRNVTVTVSDPGYKDILRFNCGTVPFNNPSLRRAVAAAVSQRDFTEALIGSDSDQRTCFAMYPCGLPGVEELGKAIMGGVKDFKVLAEQVKKSGYKGEKIVLLNTTDVNTLAPMGPVLLDMLTKLGMKVDMQTVDLNTLAARRMSQEPVEKGGWSLFVTQASTPVLANPVVGNMVRGLGINGFAGNFSDPELEADIKEWIGAATEQERLGKFGKIQRRLWEMMPIVPISNYPVHTAFRSDLTGYIQATVPLPWNIRRA